METKGGTHHENVQRTTEENKACDFDIHHKQILLFLIMVVLPSSVLVALAWRMVGQQGELREKRLARRRSRKLRGVAEERLICRGEGLPIVSKKYLHQPV